MRGDARAVIGRFALLASLIIFTPGCFTKMVVEYASAPTSASDTGGFCAIGRIARGTETLQVAAMTFGCRVSAIEDGAPRSRTTIYDRVPSERALGLACPEEQVLAAYAPAPEAPVTIAVLEAGGAHLLAMRAPDGSWVRAPVSTFEARRPPGAGSGARWVAVVPLFVLACVGDAVIFGSVVGGWAAILIGYGLASSGQTVIY